jgi:RNase adaptor protein for sRNA GlmZ degradation
MKEDMDMANVTLTQLTDDDREQFILDNQRAFKFGAMEEFGNRDDHMEEDGEIITFLGHVFPLVDAHVERFVSRGFTHLQVSFGCTGGQHRSAYSAQKLAEHLAGRPGVRVHLHHRELGIERTL